MPASIQSPVPKGFPAKLEGPLAWDGETYQNDPVKYVLNLSANEIQSVDKALRHFQGLKLAPGHLTTKTFPLPSALSAKLAQISDELYKGRGFAVVRGLNPQKYKPEENTIKGHIRNAQSDRPRQDKTPGELRPSKRNEEMAFHTDTAAGDILAMYIKGLHEHTGGKQYLSSFWRIYNVLAKEAPDVLHTLARSFPWEDADPVTREPRVDHRPLIFSVDNKVQIQYVTVPLLGSRDHPRPGNIPALTASQKKALGVFQSAAERVSFELDRELGDIQFVNNLSILHGRTAFATETSDSRISAYTNVTTETVIATKNTSTVANLSGDLTPYNVSVNSTTGEETGIFTSADPTSATTTATTTTTCTDTGKEISSDGKNTTTTTTTNYRITTTIETTTTTPTNASAAATASGEPKTELEVTTQDSVNGDPNTQRTITTTTTTFYTNCQYIASVKVEESGTLRNRLIGYASPRHFLRLFLRDGRHSWRKPDVYRERIDQCFSVPADKQHLPSVDYDPYEATVNIGGEPHG
ncbi:hypothetical protein FGG08_002267 [Glutinoglossum americanum]|uniref:TauD/TfdA-like domain-containing protein n=1 Tax=Glutinoglossum americanum TaxID=1670608 RepID=A0A9P8I560_9PEZI|nr:hypothetical protein FGG08_002267 [Glutinoglossum americanum]